MKLANNNQYLQQAFQETQQTMIPFEKQLLDCGDVSYELQQVIDCLDAHVYWKGLDGEYLACNQVVAIFHDRCDVKEIFGKTDKQLLSEHVSNMVKEHDNAIMISQKTTLYDEYESDKKLHFLSRKSPLFNKNREVIGIVGVSIDVTERKKLTLELQQAKEGIFTFEHDIEVIADSDFLHKDLHKKSQYLTSGTAISLSVEAKKFYRDVINELSIKQLDVLYLTLSGYKMKMIAYQMNIGIETVKTYIKQIRVRLNYHCTATMLEDCFKYRIKYQFERSQALMNKFHR
ncbi:MULTISPECIES: PAS domain-containing protein [Cysteiniphilum]|uniref:PAS domain-containing protein n=1 Tax=Cysteiniphilum TaxID=2056696 RepID=UPI001781F37E|nr:MULTISPECIES: PAS domain-containing protein [Cysteiniphilum]